MASFGLVLTGITSIDVTLLVISSFIALFAGTLAFTECRYWLQSRGNGGRFEGREPPTLPYAVPWFGGIFRMMDPHRLFEHALRKSPHHRPVRVRLGSLNIYLLFGDKNLRTIFKGSKTLTKVPSASMLMRSLGCPPPDDHIFMSDTSGNAKIPITNIPDEKRVWHKTHIIGTSHLATGDAVNVLTTNFMKHFLTELDKEPIGKTDVTGLFAYFKKAMFYASTIALAGSDILYLDPDYKKTYWDFDESFLLIAIGLPKAIYPKGHAIRNRMLETGKKWIKNGWENIDDKGDEPDWDRHLGSKFTRELVMALGECGVSHEGQASAMISMIWAMNSNAIPCAVWVLMETLQRPGLFQRLRSEISQIAIQTPSGDLTVDVPKLITQCPLLTSIYLECLRLRSSNTITRTLTEDFECDGYVLKKGGHIMSPGWLAMHGPLWDVPGHPAAEFWPERFIEMPKMKQDDPHEKAQYDVAMKPENFFPYGGGNLICTGRFFAKQEILAAVALLVLKFDFEPTGWIGHNGKGIDGPAKPDEAFAGGGILPPDRDMIVRMTRVK